MRKSKTHNGSLCDGQPSWPSPVNCGGHPLRVKTSSQEQASPAPPQPSAGLLELLGRPVEGLSLDEIAATCQGLAEQVRCAGMQSLEALYLAEDRKLAVPQKNVSTDHVRKCLGKLPVSQMSLDELTTLLTDLGFVARNEGIASLAPLIDEIDYPLLRRSLQLLVDSGDLHAQSARWGAKHRRIWFPVRWQCWPGE